MNVWPYMPVGEIIEAVEWSTDVMRSQSVEQRIQLRAAPRRTWQFKHLFNHDRHAAARALLRGTTDAFIVPDFTRALYIGAVSAGSSVSLSVDTADLDVSKGDTLVVCRSPTSAESVTVESVGASEIVLEEVATDGRAMVYAADIAQTLDGLRLTRPAGRYVHAEIQFKSLNSVPDAAASQGYATYRGHDVLPNPPVVGSGSFSESVTWPAEWIENVTGASLWFTARTVPDEIVMNRWHDFTPAAIRATREWVFSRRGRLKAFWRSSWARDLTAAAGIASASTTLRVFTPTGAVDLGRQTLDLEIHGLAVYRRRVSDIVAGPAVSGRATLDLTLDSALGADHTAGQIGRISMLTCLRFDADRVEFQRAPGAGVAVAVPCIEVPVP